MDFGRTRKNNKVSNRYCTVPQCRSKQSAKVSLHRLPKDPNLQKQWLDILKIGEKAPKYTFVCSLHFNRTDYILPDVSSKRPTLKKNVVPSQNIPVDIYERQLDSNKKTIAKEKVVSRTESEKNLEVCEKSVAGTVCGSSTNANYGDMDAAQALIELSSATTLSKFTKNATVTTDKVA